MFEKFFFNKTLFAISIISLFIPGTWFTAYRTDIDLYVIKILSFITIVVLFISLIFSLFLKIILKKNFLNIFSAVLLSAFIFFYYYHFEFLIITILQDNLVKQHTEISMIVTFLIGSIFFILSLKNNKVFIRFISILLPLLLLINIVNSFVSAKSEISLKHPIFSNESFFKDKKIKEINNNMNKKNIYYIFLDGAVSLDFFNEKIDNINIAEFNKELNKHNFKVVKGVQSNYQRQIIDLDSITISEILNLNQFKNAEKFYKIKNLLPIVSTDNFFLEKCKIHMCLSDGIKINLTDFNARNLISSKATFPTILKNVKYTALGKILKKTNYHLTWVGSKDSNCIYFDQNLCLDNEKNLLFKFKNFLNFNEMYKSNYVLRNYFHQTPLLKLNYRLNKEGFRLDSNLNNAQIQIDSISRFMNTSNPIKKNSFTFIHFGLPKINFVNKDVPVVFNADCSLNKINKRVNFYDLGNEKLQYFNVKNYNKYYKSNYLCMTKRIKEFVEYINLKDPDSQVVLQAGYNVPILNRENINAEYDILTIAKVDDECTEKFTNIKNQIDTVKLLLSCSLNNSHLNN